MPVTLHLLSPAGRPVQVTRDLAGFWRTTDFEVRKDLKGRYPGIRGPTTPWSPSPRGARKRRGNGEPPRGVRCSKSVQLCDEPALTDI